MTEPLVQFLVPPDDAAHAGALFLDQHEPDWFERVNPSKLDLSHFTSCVLGQLYGRYDTGIRSLFALADSDPSHSELGFCLSYFGAPAEIIDVNYAYRVLTDAWKNETLRRRVRAGAKW